MGNRPSLKAELADAIRERDYARAALREVAHAATVADSCGVGFREEVFAILRAGLGEKNRPMILHCPKCLVIHVDLGPWAERRHVTHRCSVCEHEWRPREYPTVGVGADPRRDAPQST